MFRARTLLTLLFLLSALAAPAQAAPSPAAPAAPLAPGDLDPAFGGFGDDGQYVVAGMGGTPSDVALLPDGRIVTLGTVEGEILLMQFLPNGGLDTSFYTTGILRIKHPQGGVEALSLAIQPDGKIVVAGVMGSDFMLARIHPVNGLDASFDGDGFVRTDFRGHYDEARKVLIQPDGKILAAGYTLEDGDVDMGVARYLATGAPDNSFGGFGKAIIGFGGWEVAYDMALQPDGKIVLAGYSAGAIDTDFALARLHPNGAPDNGFDNDGKLTTGFGNLDDTAYAVALQPDGKIVAGGHDDDGDVLLARYHENGELDNTLDGDGKITLPVGHKLADLAVGADGRVLILGEGSPSGDFELYRMNPGGALDSSFDGDGSTSVSFGGHDVPAALAVLPDGRILAYGSTGGSGHALVRLWHDGSPDTSGRQALGFADLAYGPGARESAHAMAFQGDGKIVVAGEVFNPANTASLIALARFLPDGRLDQTFGEQGRVLFGFAQYNGARAIAIQPDGKIVVAGYADPPGPAKADFLVVRFNADGAKDGDFNFFGFNLADFGGGDDFAQAVAIAPDGKVVVAGAAWNGVRHVFGAARFGHDGAPDLAFDGDGRQTVTWAVTNWASALLVQADRKIVIGGHVANDFALVRLRENGSTDFGFGPGGLGFSLDDMGGLDYINALAVGPGGRFYAAGVRGVNGNADFALAEYTPNGVLSSCNDFPCFNWPGGKQFVDFGGPNDSAFAIDVRSDGRVLAAGCADGKFAWAQLRTSSLLVSTIKFTADFAGPNECAFGAKFVGLDQVLMAGVHEFHGDRNMALARFFTAPKPPNRIYVPLVVN